MYDQYEWDKKIFDIYDAIPSFYCSHNTLITRTRKEGVKRELMMMHFMCLCYFFYTK